MTRERPLHIVDLSHLMLMPPFVWRNDGWYLNRTGRCPSECYGAVYSVERGYGPGGPSSCFWIVPGTLAEGASNWTRAHLKKIRVAHSSTGGEDNNAS